MSNVVRLETENPVPVPVCPEVIDMLEQLLERAKRGEINGIAFATIHSPGPGQYLSCASGWAGDAIRANVHTVLGSIEALKWRFWSDSE
jgi:hypothetical protein